MEILNLGTRSLLLLAGICFANAAWAQVPAVAAVVNAASFDNRLALGSMAAVFGSNLSNGMCQAQTLPLPATLCDARVTIGSKTAPFSFASATQLTVQIPVDVPTGQVDVIVERQGTRSMPFRVTLETHAPAVFGTAFGTAGNLVVGLRANSSVLTAQNPAGPGETISIAASGLGPTNPEIPTGVPAPFSPLAATVTQPRAAIGGQQAAVLNAFLSPGFVGSYQVAVVVPESLADGNHPVTLEIAGKTSNSPLLPVRRSVSLTAVVNGASFAPERVTAPFTFLSVFGSNFGTQQNLNAFPATDFAGLSVTFNGIRAPLVHVIPAANQINLIAPAELPESGDATVQIRTVAGVSSTFTVRLAAASPGIFRIPDPSNPSRRNAAVLFANTAWRVMPPSHARALQIPDCAAEGVTPAAICGKPAGPGDVLQIFLTGLGKATPGGDPAGRPLASGSVAPAGGDPLYRTVLAPAVTIGDVPAEVLFSGLAPGLAIYQINVVLPQAAPAGDDVLLRVAMPNGASDTATVAIRR